jgi:NagD protein
MIGDTMDTDILGGVQLGFHTVLVLSGGTRRADVERFAYRPELVVDSIAELHRLLEERRWQAWWLPKGRARGAGIAANGVAA